MVAMYRFVNFVTRFLLYSHKKYHVANYNAIVIAYDVGNYLGIIVS